jgi:hypothetical protein
MPQLIAAGAFCLNINLWKSNPAKSSSIFNLTFAESTLAQQNDVS